ncbi:MAG: hypothetical protein DMF61_20820 [Blastocatellia bacterium AA13]|nr:MAG: hypothetical protein DMF61_20820 [Blastocatellia bacterium AA13]
MPKASACRIDRVLDFIEDKWTIGILHELSLGPRRTLEILGAFNGLSPRTLGIRLKKLNRSGILKRQSFPESPPRVEWSLTEKGRDLLVVVAAITEVASRWKLGVGENPTSRCRVCVATEAGERISAPELTEDYSEDLSSSQSRLPNRARKRTDIVLL